MTTLLSNCSSIMSETMEETTAATKPTATSVLRCWSKNRRKFKDSMELGVSGILKGF